MFDSAYTYDDKNTCNTCSPQFPPLHFYLKVKLNIENLINSIYRDDAIGRLLYSLKFTTSGSIYRKKSLF